MDKISVIVPVYNVEKYIDKCIDSIVKQTYSNLEIILVNDGSTDNSGKKCDEWADTDNRIKVIHKDNGGLSDARNAGMAISTGEYIGFVDSDDWIDVRMYESLYRVIKKYGARVSLCQFKEACTEDVDVEENERCTVYSGRNLLRHMFEGKTEPYVTYSVWKFLYQTELIDKLSFPVGRLYEDVLFTTKALWNEEQVPVCHQEMYFYRIRPESITQKKLNKKNIEDVFEYCDGLLTFYENNASIDENAYLREAVLWTILSYRYVLGSTKEEKELASRMNNYLRHNTIDKTTIKDNTFIKSVRYTAWSGPLVYRKIYRFISGLRKHDYC